MAVGDQQDILGRLKALLPNGWFRSPTPLLDGALNGIAWALALAYSLTGYARLQTRVGTATDGFLDLISFDFFGKSLPRKSQELDAPFRARILAALFPERGTRHGLVRALQILTGRTPWVFEPTNAADTGGYDMATSMGYDLAGGYGAYDLPYQMFVIAYRPLTSGIPNIAGYDNPQGAYDTPTSSTEYTDLSMVNGYVTDADIYAAIDMTKTAGTTVWTALSY